MNLPIKIFILFVILLIFRIESQGQDIHFSQFFNTPSNVNPGLTGFTDSKMRVNFTHRNQWASVSLPFQTFSASVDGQLFKRKQKGDIVGIGFNAFSDKAGDSKFGTQSFSLSLNYIKALGEYSTKNLIGFGLQIAYVERSLDYQSLIFDSQYNGIQYDPNIFHGEVFAIDNYSFYDIGAGINWHTYIDYDIKMQTGLSIWHINQPEQSLLNNESIKLPIKLVFHVESEISIEKPYRILPAIIIQRQGTYTEAILGARFKYISSSKTQNYAAFITGIFYRNLDALILYTGYQLKTLEAGLSYDFNISTLKNASKYLGGVEINIIYRIPAHRQPKPKDLPCPIF
jgi:type IX secretion system PorP/SprF family membrane protein